MAEKPGFAAELSDVRKRLERSETRQNLKTGAGGSYDIDYLAGALQASIVSGWWEICRNVCAAVRSEGLRRNRLRRVDRKCALSSNRRACCAAGEREGAQMAACGRSSAPCSAEAGMET